MSSCRSGSRSPWPRRPRGWRSSPSSGWCRTPELRPSDTRDGARKDAERYDAADSLYAFYARRIAKGDTRFEAKRDALLEEVFPQGFETVTSTPTGKPQDGAVIDRLEPKAIAAGFHGDDVLIALDGTRAHSSAQWGILVNRGTGPDMRVLVYRGGAYLEVRCPFDERAIPARIRTHPHPR